eukprot:484664-Amphidinium_carterae.2
MAVKMPPSLGQTCGVMSVAVKSAKIPLLSPLTSVEGRGAVLRLRDQCMSSRHLGVSVAQGLRQFVRSQLCKAVEILTYAVLSPSCVPQLQS